MSELTKKIESLNSLYVNSTSKDFIAETNLIRLGLGTYTDKNLVFKFEPDTSEPEALQRAKGIKYAQQFVIYHNGVLVSEFVDKKEFVVGTKVPDKHIDCLIRTLLKLRKRDISFRDCHRKNLLYSKKDGFTLIDFCNEDEKLKDPFLPVHNLAFFMEEKNSDKYFLKTYARLLNSIYQINKKAFNTTLSYFINKKDVEYLFPFKRLNNKTKGYSEWKNIFEKHGVNAKNISYNRYAGTFLLGV